MIKEKRQSRRFNGRIGIISSDLEGLNFGFITNLSRDGAYVETEKLLSIGTPFEFVVSNGIAEAKIFSRVVRCRDSFFHGGKSGLGVHFETLQGMARSVRDDLLLCFMNQKFQSIWDQQQQENTQQGAVD